MLIHKTESVDKSCTKHIEIFLKLEGGAIADALLVAWPCHCCLVKDLSTSEDSVGPWKQEVKLSLQVTCYWKLVELGSSVAGWRKAPAEGAWPWREQQASSLTLSGCAQSTQILLSKCCWRAVEEGVLGREVNQTLFKIFLQKPKLPKVLEDYTNSHLNQDGLGRRRGWN